MRQSGQQTTADPVHRRTRKVVFDKRKDAPNQAALPSVAATVRLSLRPP
jgi:hypothetical protein